MSFINFNNKENTAETVYSAEVIKLALLESETKSQIKADKLVKAILEPVTLNEALELFTNKLKAVNSLTNALAIQAETLLETFKAELDLNEGTMSEIHMLADNAKDVDDFINKFFKEFGAKIKKSKDSKEWAESLYTDMTAESVIIEKDDSATHLDALADLVGNAKSFMAVGKELKAGNYKYDFSTGMMPIYTIEADGFKFAILNKKYVDGGDREVGDIAIGLMESYDGDMSDFKYEFPMRFEEATGNSPKAIKGISKKGKNQYQVNTSTYMSEREMKSVADAMGMSLVSYRDGGHVKVSVYEATVIMNEPVVNEGKGFKNTVDFEKFLIEIDGMGDYDIKKIMGKDHIDTPGFYQDEKKDYDGVLDFMRSNMGQKEFDKLESWWENNVAESVQLDVNEKFYRMSKDVVEEELYAASKALRTYYDWLEAGNDSGQGKTLDHIINLLKKCKDAIKKFNKKEEVEGTVYEATVIMDAVDPKAKSLKKLLKKYNVTMKVINKSGPGGGWPEVEMTGSVKDLTAVLADPTGWDDADLAEYIDESVVTEIHEARSINKISKDLEKTVISMKNTVDEWKIAEGDRKAELLETLRSLNNKKAELTGELDSAVAGKDRSVELALSESDTDDPTDVYEVKPCKLEKTPWAVWEGDVRVKCFETEEEAQTFADAENKKEGLEESKKITLDSLVEKFALVNEAKPAGLSKKETLKVAQKFADALTKLDGKKFTVNSDYEEDSFDLDVDGEEYEGGSYNINADGSVVNMAVRHPKTKVSPTYGNIDDDIKTIIKNIKNLKESVVTEGKTISSSKISMMGAKVLNKIRIGTIFDTKNGQYEVTGFGQQANAFKEFEAEHNGKQVKVKLTAMYGVKLEVTDDVRSARFNKEVVLNSIILESVVTVTENLRSDVKKFIKENSKDLNILADNEEWDTMYQKLYNEFEVEADSTKGKDLLKTFQLTF